MIAPRQYIWRNSSLEHVCDKISRLSKVESAEVTDIGTIKVIIHGMDRSLREDILNIGKNAMLAIQVFYKMPDGNVVGEQNEWVGDYYKPLHVPGFAGSPKEAPPDEVASKPDGAQKLKRIRAKTRGRPVVGWRLGDNELRVGTKVKFSREAALQWSLGRTLTVRPGATAEVSELSSRRPIAFIKIGGDYSDVELPIHMMGQVFQAVMPAKMESVDEVKKTKPKSEFNRLMMAIGWGRDPDEPQPSDNNPVFRDRWKLRDGEWEEDVEDAEEDMLGPDPDDTDNKASRDNKALILSKR